MRKRLGFTNRAAVAVLAEDFLVTMVCLGLCLLAVRRDYHGSLPYLSALIALEQVKVGVVLPFVINKSRAENTSGGIIFEKALRESEQKIDC